MNLQELEEKSGHPARLIRFLIGREVVPGPSGGRRFASYGDDHLRALAIYGAAKAEGVESLEVIKAKIEAGTLPSVHAIAEGIELRIEDGSVPDVGEFIEMVRRLAAELTEKK
jgi:MerR family copper efflux transcriptional regulator